MWADVRRRSALAALSLLPKSTLSHLAGRAAGRRLPRPIRNGVIRGFGRTFGVDFSEVRDPLDSFASLQDFFTRALREGARPIDPAPDAFVAPCDGAWGASGTVEQGLLLQVKGRRYSLSELLKGIDTAPLEGGAFATLYLSPRDYHRFHMPCTARIVRATYLPGALWPVNRLGVEGVEALFARNERLCVGCRIAPGEGDADLWIVAVGATMVGKAHVVFDDLSTHVRGVSAPQIRDYDPSHDLAKGDELGRFEFGSTLVLVAAPRLLSLTSQPPGTPLRLGTRIGILDRSSG